MLYNNPVAYGTDFLPEQIKELAAEHENFEAVKESSTDVRRVTWIRELTATVSDLVGVDDAIVEGMRWGGWLGRGTGECVAERVSRSVQLCDEW
jgi:4-hydroxy-tetrahydrodipicolinate synthase